VGFLPICYIAHFRRIRRFRVGLVCPFLLLPFFVPLSAQETLLPVFHFNRLTTADGLPTTEIRSPVVCDRHGFIWIGTVNGLARYDGYSCKVYRNIPNDPHSISSNSINALHVDRRGLLWIGTFDTGVSLYDAANDRFVNFLPLQNDTTWLPHNPVVVFKEDRAGDIWIGSYQSSVVLADLPETMDMNNVAAEVKQIQFRRFVVGKSWDSIFWIDDWDEANLLVASGRGIFTIDRVSRKISPLPLPPVEGMYLDSVKITDFGWETQRRLWISTYAHGLYLLDRTTGSITGYHKRPANGKQPRDDLIMDSHFDGQGRLWVGTTTGLDLFDPSAGAYREYLTLESTPPEDINWLSVDHTGRLWVSTRSRGVFFLPPRSFRIPHYGLRGANGMPGEMETIDQAGDKSFWIGTEGRVIQLKLDDLSVSRTVNLFKGEKSGYGLIGAWDSYNDGKGSIWYGTWGLGLYRFEPGSGRVMNYRPSKQLAGLTYKTDICRSVAGVGGDSLWVAAFRDGLLQFDTRTNTFAERSEMVTPRLPMVADVMKDNAGKVWISDEVGGLFVFGPATGSIEHFKHEPNNPTSLSLTRTRNTYQDGQGRIWVGSNVLNLWEPETGSFRHFPNTVFNGAVYAIPIGSDARGRLWTYYLGHGLSLLNPETGTFAHFGGSDGLCGGVVKMHLLKDGRVMLVGYQGMNIVHPDSLFTPQPAPPLVITRMSVNDSFNVPVQRLPAALPLQLTYDQNTLEIEFAAIEPSQLIGYYYRLEGLEDVWVHPENRRFVRYPGLSPGEYVLRIKAVSIRSYWPEQQIAIALSISPPWWRTKPAYALYGILLIGLLSAAYRVRVRQLSLRQRAEHMAEVDRLKSRFFANISHEFRTPLTLILGPIQKWKERFLREHPESANGLIQTPATESLSHTSDAGELQRDLSMVERNAHRLLRLINQLLDLSKLEAGAMNLRASRLNIVPLVRGIAYSFESSAGLRHISLDVVVGQEEIEVYGDRDMLEQIISNLVSNAFKFTPEGGSVTVSVGLAPKAPGKNQGTGSHRGPGRESVEITVADTGAGIPPEQLDRIFDRFYQVDASQTREHEGSGIGLALVKELVELHHGTIEIRSRVGNGTVCTVRLPLGRGHLKDEEIAEGVAGAQPATREGATVIADENIESVQGKGEYPMTGDQHSIILVIEDNVDVRAHIRSVLVPPYHVLEARDGAEGIEKAQEAIPDLIISDVMMPKKDGYEVCRTLKLDEKTSHIPIILLTAKAASENRIEGLETGADDYLTKPFEPKELMARIKNLINLRRKLRERFSARQVLKPGEVTVSSIDDQFLQRLKNVVEAHIAEEAFGVDELAREAGMSRSQIHRKLTALTGMSAGDFVRYLRLHRAMDLLRQNAATVAEIAYMVGFSTPAHFTKCFHELFGVTPSEIRRAEP
jgi:signal transduction histidine kinase/ligand-binding sensor domain-containing protein/DNA-binding response OmpR family regulator